MATILSRERWVTKRKKKCASPEGQHFIPQQPLPHFIAWISTIHVTVFDLIKSEIFLVFIPMYVSGYKVVTSSVIKNLRYKNPECFKAKIYSDGHFQFHAILVWGMNEGFGLKTSQWVLRNLQTGPSYDFLHSLSWQRLIFFVSKILAINIIPHIWHVQVKYKQYFSNCKDSMMQESVVPWICYNKDHMSSQQRVWERSDWKDKTSINTIFTDTMISYHNTSCD